MALGLGLACFSALQPLTRGPQHGYGHNLQTSWASPLSQAMCWALGDDGGQ